MARKARAITTFKTLIKKIGGSKGAKCHYPVRMDTYGKGCEFNCRYCYSCNILSHWGLWQKPIPVDITAVEKMFHTIFETDKPHRYRKLLEDRKRIRLGGMCDVFMPQEKELGVTYRLLQLFSQYNIPYLIITKSDLIATKKYQKALRIDLANIQLSIASLNRDASLILEPGAPTPMNRIFTLYELSKAGFDTALRVAPIILDINGQFDFQQFEKMLTLGQPRTAIIEFLRISKSIKEKIRQINPCLYPRFESNYWFMDPKFKYKVCKELRNICRDHKVAFTICEEESEMYEKSKRLWANPANCCNIRDTATWK